MGETVKIGLVGCGFMGIRHLHGFRELRGRNLKSLELTAVCDMDKERVHRAADLAETHLGRRPTVYTDYAQMLETERKLDAVDIVVDPCFHHVLADQAFKAGKHVLVEKPLGITVKACQRMVDSAKKCGKTLAVAENYRRDLLNRLVKAALENGVISKPYFMVQSLVEGGNRIIVTPWRHMKEKGGILVDMGVHYADLLRYFFGEAETVYGQQTVLEKVRKGVDIVGWPANVKPSSTGKSVDEEVRPTAEDTAFAIIKFKNGVLCHWLMSLAGHGEKLWQRTIFGSSGRVDAPLDRSGKPLRVTFDDGRVVSGDEILKTAKVYKDNDITAKVFPEGLTHYNLPFQEADRRLIAIELYDFADAVLNNGRPEVDGADGLRDAALTYAICESSCLGEPVRVSDVESGKVSGYQRSINEAWNID